MAESAPTTRTRSSGSPSAALGRDVADFLIELSIAVHRYSMYPLDHPSLVPAAGNVLNRVSRLLEDRMELSLGVARRQLVIDGVATDQRNPVLSDLAKRLHSHHIGAVTFTDEVNQESIEGLLCTLAEESEREGDPIGLRPAHEIPSWPGLKLFAVGYADLSLDQDGEAVGDTQVMQLWLGLARAAMSGVEGFEEAGEAEPGAIAEQIRARKERAYDEVIVGYLLQIADELGDEGQASGPLRAKISELVAELDPETLRRILRMGGDTAQRRQFVRGAMKGRLGTEASVKILQAAADASDQEISALMVRMLTKLSFHAEEGQGEVSNGAQRVVREKVDELLADWHLDNPNPDGYVRILDELSQSSPYLNGEKYGEEFEGSALSMIQMAIEVDSYGPMVEQALDHLLIEGELPQVAPMLEGAQWTEAGRRIRERVGSPSQIDALTQFDDVSDDSLGLLVELVGTDQAIEPLLRVLADAPSRALRRTVFDRLASLGPAVADHIGPFLEDPRWYVLRNMLSLLEALGTLPDGFDPKGYINHPDIRVRRVALPLGLANPSTRLKTLAAALREEDERSLRTALLNLREDLPPTIAPIVLDRVVKPDTVAAGLRALGVRVLQRSKSPPVRDALCDVASSGRSLFGRPRLRSVDGEAGEPVLAALSVLARSWSDDSRVRPLLKAASKRKELSIRRALEGRSQGRAAKPVAPALAAHAADANNDLWEGRA